MEQQAETVERPEPQEQPEPTEPGRQTICLVAESETVGLRVVAAQPMASLKAEAAEALAVEMETSLMPPRWDSLKLGVRGGAQVDPVEPEVQPLGPQELQEMLAQQEQADAAVAVGLLAAVVGLEGRPGELAEQAALVELVAMDMQ
jgi:hypothetical protein